MDVYKSIDQVVYQKNSYLTIGTFDGIHVGHEKIIKDLVRKAKEKKARSVLVTFHPHPQIVVQSQRLPISLLTPFDEKINFLETLGLDLTLAYPFTKKLARMEPEHFVREILVKSVGVQEFVIGYNHKFGRKRKGGVELLRMLGSQLGFNVKVIQPVKIDREVVSSTRIRYLLWEGKIRQANRFLGRRYSLTGLVKKGKNLGSKIGFPTANIDLVEKGKLIPSDGVYTVFVYIEGGQQLSGMVNIGRSPTMGVKNWGIEVHIHNFSGELYNKELKVEFVHRIRGEKQFDSVNDLIKQIRSDRDKSLELLSTKF